MKYDCSKEFDLNSVYKKLTSNRHDAKVCANKFFCKCNELELLQAKMALLSLANETAASKHKAN
ncbi:MAG: hypothetical protein ACI4QL_01595 [Candidatus Fimimonas sp.]